MLNHRESSKQFKVLLLTRATAAQTRGGPGLTVQLLLKTHQRSKQNAFTLSAVFCDRVISSCEKVASKRATSGQTSLLLTIRNAIGKHIPRSFHAATYFISSTIKFLFHLERAIMSKQSACVLFHAHDFVAAYAGIKLYRHRFPLVLTIHDKGGWVREALNWFPVYHDTFIEKLLRHIEVAAVRQADVMVFTSQGSRVLFEGEHPGLLQSKHVRVVYPGIDTEELELVSNDEKLLTEYEISQSTTVLLCIGALIRDKGIDTLIEAIALLPEETRSRLNCFVVGRGHLRNELKDLIIARGLENKVKLLGFLSRQELLQLMRSSTAFVLPSRVAVFDYALLEAGVVGLPIVTTSVGGNLEMFDEDSALLVPPEDPQMLAAAIARLLSDEALRQHLSQNACHRLRSRFSLEAMFNAYAAIYEEMEISYYE